VIIFTPAYYIGRSGQAEPPANEREDDLLLTTNKWIISARCDVTANLKTRYASRILLTRALWINRFTDAATDPVTILNVSSHHWFRQSDELLMIGHLSAGHNTIGGRY